MYQIASSRAYILIDPDYSVKCTLDWETFVPSTSQTRTAWILNLCPHRIPKQSLKICFNKFEKYNWGKPRFIGGPCKGRVKKGKLSSALL